MSKPATINWTTEAEAMQLLGYTNKNWLRVLCRDKKRKKLNIRTSKVSKSKLLYSKTDIDNYINSLVQ